MSAFTMRRPLVKTGLRVRPLGIGGGGSISDDDSSSGEIFLKWKHCVFSAASTGAHDARQ